MTDIEFYTEAKTADCAHARILLVGRSKCGKTTSLVTTAPGPTLVLNADGDSALKYARKLGASYNAWDIESMLQWKQGYSAACKAAEEGKFTSIILDSVSLLALKLHAELAKSFDGFKLYGNLGDALMAGLLRLLKAPAHVIVVAHMLPSSDDADIVPLVKGQSKEIIPGLVHDCVLFDYNADDTKVPRKFLVGPQKSWNYSGRNVNRSISMPADVKLLFEELGLTYNHK